MKEPEYTCKIIDNLISSAKSIEKDSFEIVDRLTEISRDANDLIHELEVLRNSNSDLRDWGQYWKDKYDELYDQ